MILGRLGGLVELPARAVQRGGHRGFYFLSLAMLILFVVIYNRLSKPINRLQTEAAKTGGRLDNVENCRRGGGSFGDALVELTGHMSSGDRPLQSRR